MLLADELIRDDRGTKRRIMHYSTSLEREAGWRCGRAGVCGTLPSRPLAICYVVLDETRPSVVRHVVMSRAS